ncbi:MAG: hypothetical protein NTY71_05395 [Methanoregula sp.]|nr:hypothetical protein [Methanoregula sp.]
MAEQTINGTIQSEGARPSEGLFPLEKEYARTMTALNRTGILTQLLRSENSGVIGIDGKEYPVPTQEQLQEVFTRNKELVDRKMRQGFTRLQLTPIAMPVSQLIDRVKTAVLNHAAAGKIIRTKQNSTDADIPVRVNTGEPIWIWDRVRQAVDTPDLVYFPQAYTDRNHQGLTKEEVMQKTRVCAVPGWSVGLIEPIPVMPQQGQGNVTGGRKQLEGYSTPHDYLRTLSTPTYQGETGWTPEDFLTSFITQLETTNQVRHDRYDSNALWLLGSYMPNSGGNRMKRLVPVGYWDRGRLYLSVHRSGNRLRGWVARSTVRLGT